MSLLTQQPSSLIKKRSFTVVRTAVGSYNVDGIYVKPTPTNVAALLLVYPEKLSTNIVDILPEGLRKKKIIRIFSDVELKELKDKQSFEPDEITYNGEAYRVFKVGDWINVSGFSGYEAHAVRIDTKDLPVLVGG